MSEGKNMRAVNKLKSEYVSNQEEMGCGSQDIGGGWSQWGKHA